MILILLFLWLITIPATAQHGFVEGSPQIAYWKVGSETETVIVVHGGPGVSHDYLRPEWDRLTTYATVIYYDQRGNGKSEKANCYSWREHVEDLRRLINEISPNDKVVLAGSSWGVELAVLFAHTYPDLVKGIILTGTVAWQGGGGEKQDCKNYSYQEPTQDEIEMLNNALEKFNNEIDSTYFKDQPPLFASEEVKALKNKNIQGSDEVQYETLNSLKDAPSYNELRIDVPVIVFQGTEKCSYQDVSSQYADLTSKSEIVYIEEACHDPWLVHPDDFFAKCGQFIRNINRL
jgi:proline iminopeptidase